jgi:hypothetical protein
MSGAKPSRHEFPRKVMSYYHGELAFWPPSRGQYKIAMATADIASNPSNLALFFPSQPRLNDSEMPFTASCLLIKYLLFTRVFRVIEIASNLRK